MFLKHFTVITLVLTLGFVNFSDRCVDAAWPEPRPLVKDIVIQHSSDIQENFELNEPNGILTLSQVLSLALMKNPQLKAFSLEIRIKEAQTLQAGILSNPEIGIEVENFGGSGEFNGLDSADSTFQLSQLIELGGKRSKRKHISKLEWELTGWDYESKRLEVFSEVVKDFVDVLASQERLILVEELVSIAEQTYDTVLERVRAGKVSPLEETKAGVTLATNRIKLGRSKHKLQAARKRLAAAWGRTTPIFQKVGGQLDVIKSIPSVDQLINRISQNPNIMRWITEMEQRRAVVKLENSLRIPDLTLSGGVRYFNNTNANTFVVGVSVPLPIFDRNQGGILEAQYKVDKIMEERKVAEVYVLTALAETYQTLSTALSEATALKDEVLPGAKSAFDAASEGFRQGKFSYLDVLDAQRTLFEVKDQYIETLTVYHKAVAEAEHLIGERLDTINNISE